MKTVFEKIIDREIPADIVFEDDLIIAFKDIVPVAPVHILIVPKKKIVSINSLELNLELAENSGDSKILCRIFEVAKKLAKENNLAEKGYRLVTNIGEEGGQSVFHLHFHLIGGRSLQWPPG